jgi:hypothetical protein
MWNCTKWLGFGLAVTLLGGCGALPDGSEDAAGVSTTSEALRRPPSPKPAPSPAPVPTSAPPPLGSADCPNSDGTCASLDQDRLQCVSNAGQYACVAPSAANKCASGPSCPTGTACGNQLHCNAEAGTCSYSCFAGGPVPPVYNLPVGGPCQSIDAHGVTHICTTAYCSGTGANATCLPVTPPIPPVSDG